MGGVPQRTYDLHHESYIRVLSYRRGREERDRNAQVSRQTPTRLLSSTSRMMAPISEKVEPRTLFAPAYAQYSALSTHYSAPSTQCKLRRRSRNRRRRRGRRKRNRRKKRSKRRTRRRKKTKGKLGHTIFSITTTTLSVSLCARLMHCATCEREVSLVVWPTVDPGLYARQQRLDFK